MCVPGTDMFTRILNPAVKWLRGKNDTCMTFHSLCLLHNQQTVLIEKSVSYHYSGKLK